MFCSLEWDIHSCHLTELPCPHSTAVNDTLARYMPLASGDSSDATAR
jgi:hypothetical protein